MKRSYSNVNLLQEKLGGYSDSKGFFSFLFSNRKYLTITIPYYDFLRGQIFVEDLHDFGADIPAQFCLDTLIYMLYDDFLSQIKRGRGSHEQIAQYLMAGYNKHFGMTKKETRIMKSVSPNLFQFETVEEEEEIKQKKEKTAYLTIRMRSSEIMRCEILLHDLELENYIEGVEISVEQVMAIIYLDFIQTIKNEGNSLKIQKSILTRLQSY